MSKRNRQKRAFKVKVSSQTKQNAALDNLDRLWKLTEQAMLKPLNLDEQRTVERTRLLLRLLLDDTPPLSIGQTSLSIEQTEQLAQEIEILLQQAPFEQ